MSVNDCENADSQWRARPIRAVAAGLCIVAAAAGGGSRLLAADNVAGPAAWRHDRRQRRRHRGHRAGRLRRQQARPADGAHRPRNVTVANAANQVSRKGAVAGVTLEQTSAVDGRAVARVRLALARPASTQGPQRPEHHPRRTVEPLRPRRRPRSFAAPPLPAVPRPLTTPRARERQDHRPRGRRQSAAQVVAVTLGGNGFLAPASVTESRDLPRRLVLDFPGVSPKAAAQTAVQGGLVRHVRIAANSREPLVTRVVMETRDRRDVSRRASRRGRSGPRRHVRASAGQWCRHARPRRDRPPPSEAGGAA